jgi:thiamine biosynthesis lipoprotein
MKKFILFILTIFVLSLGCQHTPSKITYFSGNVFGTKFNIQIFDEQPNLTPEEIDSIFTQFNMSLSNYQKNSLLSYFNINEYQNFPFDSFEFSDTVVYWLNEMITESKAIYDITNGYFDPSAESIFGYWKRGKQKDFIIDTSKINFLLQHKGMHLFEVIDGKPNKTDSLATLNFNAIAKGYAVDVLHRYFDTKGIENYLIEIGGEIRLKGKPIEKNYFNVAINQPFPTESSKSKYRILSVNETSIATSGNYRDFYYLNNEKIGHTINPKTGFPAANNLLSVTVFHQDCSIADAYATAFMAMGLKNSINLLTTQKNLSAFFIYNNQGSLKDTLILGEFNPIISP